LLTNRTAAAADAAKEAALFGWCTAMTFTQRGRHAVAAVCLNAVERVASAIGANARQQGNAFSLCACDRRSV